ncbi:unnamed protein product [Cuscuta campestris]|uniref:DUF1639 domain-containing protein n=1 Tax=Cuscuta campestris TaxID=132261 RepID=A0A484KRJ3_9ASTE|nr:unnamed protein product [Cuscuta campestris]
MGSQRSKPPLHNFTLPCNLKWGRRKFLRCGKLDLNGEIVAVHRRSDGSSSSSEKSLGWRGSEAASGLQGLGSEGGREIRAEVDDGIAAVRKRLLFDLQAATDKMKDAILKTGLRDEGRRPPVAEDGGERPPAPMTASQTITPVGPSETAGPWNFRTRRSGSKAPNGFTGDSNLPVPPPAYDSPLKAEYKSPKLPTSCAAANAASSTGERAKFSIALSRPEIEEDFAAIIRHRPSRRPRKRAKYIQKNLDSLFPGLWLTEISAEMYRVSDDQ